MKYAVAIPFVLVGLLVLFGAVASAFKPAPPRLIGIQVNSRARRLAYWGFVAIAAYGFANVLAFGLYCLLSG